MGLKIESDPIVVTLTAIGKDATDAAYEVLKRGAKDVRDLAREYAPIDDGELEKAIITHVDKASRTVEIGIDPSARDDKGAYIAQYGLWMHEGLAPFGSGRWQLGPHSQAKDAGNGKVGGKFLERALDDTKREILANAAFAVKRIFKG